MKLPLVLLAIHRCALDGAGAYLYKDRALAYITLYLWQAKRTEKQLSLENTVKHSHVN